MAYVSLYRKYRSREFAEVIGQSHVTTVLQNAIRMGRIAHAYLFCGPRGCGKTSTARLLARALNCQSGDGPTPEPCGVCDLCVRIRDGVAMDVLEMDAASETGIDDVREKIIENARFAPVEARYKVYIIDEVHDLSLKAFDSLLKTIEEPPPHVVFILATTESHKVPITVRSRCQRLDFRRGTPADLAANLRRVLEAEGIPHTPDAVAAIARAAEGSFRDSLSILEQVRAYTDQELTAEIVHEAIGAVGGDLIDEVIQVIASDDLSAAFLKAGELVDCGKDVRQTLIALQSHLRDLLAASVAKGPQALPEVTPERFARLKEQAAAFTPPQILRMLDILAEAERDVRFTNQHRLLLERALWSILPGSLGARPSEREEPAPPAPVALQRPDPARPSPPPSFQGPLDLDGLRRIWPRVLRRVVQAVPASKAFIDNARVKGLEGATVVLGFTREWDKTRLDRPRGRQTVEEALNAELGMSGLKVRCEMMDPEPERAAVVHSGLPLTEVADGSRPAPSEEAPTVDTAPAGILEVVRQEFGDRLVPEE